VAGQPPAAARPRTRIGTGPGARTPGEQLVAVRRGAALIALPLGALQRVGLQEQTVRREGHLVRRVGHLVGPVPIGPAALSGGTLPAARSVRGGRPQREMSVQPGAREVRPEQEGPDAHPPPMPLGARAARVLAVRHPPGHPSRVPATPMPDRQGRAQACPARRHPDQASLRVGAAAAAAQAGVALPAALRAVPRAGMRDAPRRGGTACRAADRRTGIGEVRSVAQATAHVG
jgi:hypothetical protein